MRDPRFRDLVVELAAPLRGVPKDELIGEDIRQHSLPQRLAECGIRRRYITLGRRDRRRAIALQQRQVAIQQRQTAIAQRDQAQRNQSRALASLAENEVERGSPATAVRLALAALPMSLDSPDRAYAREAEQTLLYGVQYLRERRALLHKRTVSSIAFSPDGRTLATGSSDKTARLWEVATGTEIGHEKEVWSSVAFSPDGRTLATASLDNTARLWEVATGKDIHVLRGHEAGVMSVAFSPDGHALATGSQDDTARLWEVATGKEIGVLRGHVTYVSSVAFSPDGRTLATGSSDKTARLWEVATGREIGVLRGHAHHVSSVAFSPDGRTLATGSWDNTARLWEVATGKEIGVLHGHEKEVWSIAFSPDGRTLATGSWDNAARLWGAATGKELIDLACARVHGLPLSEQDKQRFGIDDEWCTPEVSGALRAKLGLDEPETSAAPATR